MSPLGSLLRLERDGVAWYESPLLRDAGCRHAFSTRVGGVSAAPFDSLNLGRSAGDGPANVDENLRRFRAAVGFDSLSTATQVHGADCVRGRDATPDTPADALLALEGDAAVGVRTADCVPVLLASRNGRAVAAVHAGWRGLVGGAIATAVNALHEHGHEDLVAAVGPCIGAKAFEVGADVAARFHPDDVRTDFAKPHVDLASAAARALRDVGVRDVDVAGLCTFARAADFFSHRRDAGKTGRMLNAIAPRP